MKATMRGLKNRRSICPRGLGNEEVSSVFRENGVKCTSRRPLPARPLIFIPSAVCLPYCDWVDLAGKVEKNDFHQT